MKRFLQAAFKITLFQIIFIIVIASLKYVLDTYNAIDKIQTPFLWICLGAGVIFVFAVATVGLIESRGTTFEEWKGNPKKSTKERLLAGFVSWGTIVPSILAFVLFLYIIAPTSVLMFIALYAGIVIRNCITFFSEKQTPLT
jgi:hypothetical protein